jgi:hypothetical protein
MPPIYISCDTEFQNEMTLTQQFAVRTGNGNEIAVQIYANHCIPQPDSPLSSSDFPDELARFGNVVVRPIKVMTYDLSPARIALDLLALDHLTCVRRQDATAISDVTRHNDGLELEFIGHFLPADLFRMFGSVYLRDLLLDATISDAPLRIESRKRLSFATKGRGRTSFEPPIVEFIRQGNQLCPVRLSTFDTMLAFGKGSLDGLVQAFLGLRKVDTLTSEVKADMMTTFRDKTRDSYVYAAFDAILTLLLAEQFREQHRAMYTQLGFTADEIPPLRPTLGSTTSQLLMTNFRRDFGRHLTSLSGSNHCGASRQPSMAAVKRLIAGGSADSVSALSRFRVQTGETHGGLLFSRTPTRLFHGAPGHLREIDLSSCYATILRRMTLYLGRPVVFEPGNNQLTLRGAVALMQQIADSRWAWFVKVTGQIPSGTNVLIPSTDDALTNVNFQSRRAKQRNRSTRNHRPVDWLYQEGKQTSGTSLFSAAVESGIVAWSTWAIIQALPMHLRAEYEQLQVDSIVFYPRELVGHTPIEFDQLRTYLRSDATPWASTLDLARRQIITADRLDADYVSVAYDVGRLSEQIQSFRRAAIEEHGRGSAAEQCWKTVGNTLYGVLASPYLPSNNVVAANVITATGRAQAFAMQLSLNGHQVITDGCTFRTDQIPACSFAECLQRQRDYPLRHAEAGLPFVNATEVPNSDEEFTDWYRMHAPRFFDSQSQELRELINLHELAYKSLDGRAEFDGLICDGSANNMKLTESDGDWRPNEFKARSLDRDAHRFVQPWLMRVAIDDEYEPPPITLNKHLLSYEQAIGAARTTIRALSDERPPAERQSVAVQFPLGHNRPQVKLYRILRPSTFVFRTPAQKRSFKKAYTRFKEKYGVGFELLALRRSTGGRRHGSVNQISELIYQLIQTGTMNFSRGLNLTRAFQEGDEFLAVTRRQFDFERERVQGVFQTTIDARRHDGRSHMAGLYVNPVDLNQLAQTD